MKIEVQEINKFSVWDDFLYRQCPWNYFQLWDYGEVQKLLGAKVLRIGLIKNKEMIGQSQIFIVRAKRGNFLQIKHGPVLTIKATKNDVLFYLKKLKRIAGENGCLFIRINPLVEGKKSIFWQRLGFLPSPIHNMDAEICLKIDLLQNEEKILSLMRKTNHLSSWRYVLYLKKHTSFISTTKRNKKGRKEKKNKNLQSVGYYKRV